MNSLHDIAKMIFQHSIRIEIGKLKSSLHRVLEKTIRLFQSHKILIRNSAFGLGLIVLLLILPPLLQDLTISLLPVGTHAYQAPVDQVDKARDQLLKEMNRIDRKLAGKTPSSYYLVINSTRNEFSLYKGSQLKKRDKCSTGSYILLKNGDQQEWMFKTPKGEFSILGKTTSPVWKKPDWAFVEEGLPVPPVNHHSRYEYGVLGDYALSLGHGYLIHGTLYQRYLGLPVTHGCIRLNDENLELIYRSLRIGSKVYIY